MGSYGIGLSGLKVAQGMIDLVSTNIANATTEGYHRQEAIVRPIVLKTYGAVGIGGAEIGSVRRSVNNLLEMEITRQQSNLSQSSEELSVLKTLEAAFGDVGQGGLGEAIDRFFTSITELSADPKNEAMRVQAVWAGDAVAGEFRNIGSFLEDMETQVERQTQEAVQNFNSLTVEISELAKEMVSVSVRGGSSNILSDRRDQAIRELAELADIHVSLVSDGTVESLTISAAGTPVVSSSTTMDIEVARTRDGELGVGAKDSGLYRTNISGGKIGAMLTISNDVLSSLRGELDTMAKWVADTVNDIHIQGVGSGGSFSELTGAPLENVAVGQWDSPVVAGDFRVRMINQTTGEATRSTINVDPADELSDVAARLDAIAGLSASIVESSLKIEADAGFKFDFLPALLSDPHTSAITGDAGVAISGVYTGPANHIYTAKVVGSGRVGVADDLVLEVRDEANQLIETLDIGQGYAAGDALDLGLGMTVTLTAGQLNNDDEFTIEAVADVDTSGFLKAAGMNTFFLGSNASDISVRRDILDDPGGRLACSSSAAMTDQIGVERLIDIGDKTHAELGGISVRDYFRGIVTGVGQSIVVREARTISLENVMAQLNHQRDEISGVDLNEETAKLISLERLYQGMARVISAQDKAMGELMELL
jgi:flagellar hook-associated protein 1